MSMSAHIGRDVPAIAAELGFLSAWPGHPFSARTSYKEGCQHVSAPLLLGVRAISKRRRPVGIAHEVVSQGHVAHAIITEKRRYLCFRSVARSLPLSLSLPLLVLWLFLFTFSLSFPPSLYLSSSILERVVSRLRHGPLIHACHSCHPFLEWPYGRSHRFDRHYIASAFLLSECSCSSRTLVSDPKQVLVSTRVVGDGATSSADWSIVVSASEESRSSERA